MPDNLITLDQAVKMTTLYRQEMETILADPFKGKKILAICETFGREAFDTLLNEDDCVKVRIYYGMSDDLKVHAIVVGVNSADEDILPVNGVSAPLTAPAVVVEDSLRCPDNCPPHSPLNP